MRRPKILHYFHHTKYVVFKQIGFPSKERRKQNHHFQAHNLFIIDLIFLCLFAIANIKKHVFFFGILTLYFFFIFFDKIPLKRDQDFDQKSNDFSHI